MICAFTGHRPQKLPWGSREEDPRCRALKIMLEQAVRRAADRGYDTFLCGMARGCDTWFAEAVLRLKKQGYPVRLEAMVPCPGQHSRWSAADQQRYLSILQQCDRVQVLEPVYTDGCMLRRNRRMVDSCRLLITVYDGSGGGTGQTVAYARAQGLELDPIWV